MEDNNQEVVLIYSIELDDNGMLDSILVEEEGGTGRWLYKRFPEGTELPLSDEIFREAILVYLNDGIFETDNLYVTLRVHDEYYADLMRKVYKEIIRLYVRESSLLADAFFKD